MKNKPSVQRVRFGIDWELQKHIFKDFFFSTRLPRRQFLSARIFAQSYVSLWPKPLKFGNLAPEKPWKWPEDSEAQQKRMKLGPSHVQVTKTCQPRALRYLISYCRASYYCRRGWQLLISSSYRKHISLVSISVKTFFLNCIFLVFKGRKCYEMRREIFFPLGRNLQLPKNVW